MAKKNIIKSLLSTAISLEDDTSGVAGTELEIELYVRISDFNQLTRAQSVERQEQWTIKIEKTDKNQGKGNDRVRRIYDLDTSQGGPAEKYINTRKLVLGQGKRIEVSQEVSQDMFLVTKALSEQGMIKDRYKFPIQGTDLCFEVDAFIQPDGMYAPWLKIDLENPPALLPELPFEVLERIDGRTKDPAEREKITQLYDQYFLTKHKN